MPLQLLNDYPMGTARGNTCYVCGSGPRTFDGRRERVVDLQQNIDFEGYLMVCETCWTEGARLLGMETAEKVAALHESVKHLKAERTAKKARVKRLEAALDALRALPPKETARA